MTNPKGSILNKVDYDEIDRRIREAIDERFVFLPTKQEFFDTSDKLMGELKAIREDFAAHVMNITHPVCDIASRNKSLALPPCVQLAQAPANT